METLADPGRRDQTRTRLRGWLSRRPRPESGPNDVLPLPAAPRALGPLIAEFSVTFGAGWGPVTRRKHRDDFARLTAWLASTDRPATLAALDIPTLAAYVNDLRSRPRIRGVSRAVADGGRRTQTLGPSQLLSANSVGSYVRPIRSFAIWLVDEGHLAVNPFRRSRRRAAGNPLLPSEVTPTKSATLDDLRTLEHGCAGDRPIDLRDRAILAVLCTTAARNSSVRLLAVDDVDLERDLIIFRRAKGAKTLEVALHPSARSAIISYLEHGRPALAASRGVDIAEALASEVLFVSDRAGPVPRPLTMHALSLMLTRRYHAGGGTLPYFGSHRIRHATATLLINNGMGLEEVSRFLGHSSTDVTRRYAVVTPGTLGRQAADALARAGLAR